MHIVLVYRYYNDGIVYYNLTFCMRKSLMTDLGLITNRSIISFRSLIPLSLTIQEVFHPETCFTWVKRMYTG